MIENHGLTRPEIYSLVNEYIGVEGGYLGDFSYRTHKEFYPQYCDLDINPLEREGTTKSRFLEILLEASPETQARIVRGTLSRFPPEHLNPLRSQALYDDFLAVCERIESRCSSGVEGEIKNLIFASSGPKPEIVLSDSTLNTIEIVKNKDSCLVYTKDISTEGLKWSDLIAWWRTVPESRVSETSSDREAALELHNRLKDSCNKVERIILDTYYGFAHDKMEFSAPALIPQVYLHYDPYTVREHGIDGARLARQRMDFLLLFPQRRHLVLELDGRHHYADDDGRASTRRYAEMVAEDRKLRLRGYEVFRFGGNEFVDKGEAERMLKDFYLQLFARYEVWRGA